MSKHSPPDIHSLTADVKRLEAELAIANQLAARYESRNRMCIDLQNERARFAGQLYAHGLRLDPDGNVYPIWMPTDDVVVRFDDKTGQERSPDTVDEMVEALREVANKYDYDLKQWGSGEGFLKFAEMQLDVNKKYAIEHMDEDEPPHGQV